MSSLIERANRGNFGSQEKKQHWKYEWYTPSNSDTTTTGSTSNTEGGITKGASTKKYSFQYKTWMQTEKGIFEDGQDHDIGDMFDLAIYSGTGSANDVNVAGVGTQNGNPRDDGLTMEDIRGAVGDSEAIPGFSSADAVKEKVQAEDSVNMVTTVENATPAGQPGSEAPSDTRNNNTPSEKEEKPVELTSIQVPSDSVENNERIDLDGDLDMQE